MAEVDTYHHHAQVLGRGSQFQCSGSALSAPAAGAYSAEEPSTLHIDTTEIAYAADPPPPEPGRDSPAPDESGRRRRHGGQTPKKRRAGSKTTKDGSPNTSEGEHSFRSSGSHGPLIPAEIAPGEARAAVSKDMRVFTRAGCPRLADIVGKETEVWSGRRWIRVRVAVTPATSEFYRVRLDDGTCMVSTAGHSWAVVADGRVVPVRAQDLRTDLTISPFILFPPEDLGGTPVPQAYEMGAAFGRRLAESYKLKDGIPARVFEMNSKSLGLFIAGWMDTQKGTLFGCYAAIHGLQIALHRLGVYHTFIEDLGTYYALGLSQEDGDRIPNPKGGPREYRRAVSDLPRVTEVFLLGGRKKAYTITSDDPRARTVVLDGVLTLC